MKSTKLNKFHFILIFSLILISIVYAIQTITIEIEDVVEFSNTTDVSVPILLNNNESVAGLQFTVNHTPFLIFKDIIPTSRMPDAVIEFNGAPAGSLKVAALIEDNISIGNGAIMNLIFDVDENAVGGDYVLKAEDVIISDIDTQTIPINSIQGTFTILIDSDGDGIDDSADFCPQTFGCSQYSGCSFGLEEWLPPIIIQEEFDLQEGATLPLKFSATDCSDSFYSDIGIDVRIVNETLGIDKTYNASEEGSDYIRINETEEQYITNIHSGELEMPLGNYTIHAMFSNDLSYGIGFELVQQGKGKGKGPK